jgi:hypothetical protein
MKKPVPAKKTPAMPPARSAGIPAIALPAGAVQAPAAPKARAVPPSMSPSPVAAYRNGGQVKPRAKAKK